MKYLTHPHFDSSDRAEWIDFPLNDDSLPADIDGEDASATIIRRDFDRIVLLVEMRFRTCVPPDWLAECPHAILVRVQYHPIGDTGIQIYVEHMFRPSTTENSHHTDHWWAIVTCPYMHGDPYTRRVDYVITHFGWGVDWMM